MLGYISSTRKKSCKQCVKAKRRCDLGYPCCKRCFSKSLDCAYPNSVREAEVVIRQRTPDLAPLDHVGDNDLIGLQPVGCDFDLAILQVSTSDSKSSSSPESRSNIAEDREEQDATNRQALYWKSSKEPAVSRQMLPKIWAPSWLNEDQLLFMVSRMRSFVPTLAFTGANTFIHTALYKSHQPTAFQDSISLSALYLAKTKQNAPILIRSIDEKINGLIARSNGWSLQEHLAAVQALILYQIIRLFDGDLGQAGTAARQNHLLELWTAHLWKRSFAEPIAFSKPWDAWVFYESLRRTVMISVFMRGSWNALTQGGLCDQVPVLARLPLSKGDGFWDIREEEFDRRVARVDGRDQLVAYGDFSLSWKPGEDDVGGLTEFQRLLLVACRGHMDPRLYLDGM
ncbi:uncharacterized protein CC84DRAFT_1082465 [Paraphaeosphaeria sporulosa]|uniref:Zn(2)-C6 fungal-type domain-containing protein n=1 Tax=Paraphaeosphaeria sporulosa TaxID=1460663 RepID=A0A177CU99_9PLEO|nr:uncharacterized protein CC84DRAFT_1082465 [Paraphaeosphaeria sporulosa]OAG10492.1 hypothetical protein CC84DRAFT_1082465 [Paraphaeosphaeria sporulosa]